MEKHRKQGHTAIVHSTYVVIQRAHCDETTQIFIIINKERRYEILDHVQSRRARSGP